MSLEGGQGDIVVDLSDTSTQFWACFDAVAKENPDEVADVLTEFTFLNSRKMRHMGLTNTMVEDQVSRLLGKTTCLAPYSKYDVQMHFERAAMPNWHLWEELEGIVGPVDLQSIETNLQ